MRIKCKKCNRKYNIKDVTELGNVCRNTKCPFKTNVIQFPSRKAANETKEPEILETYEEIPFVGRIDRRELLNKDKRDAKT